ncbi:hypothetical protein CHS0354_041206 [Potamilus streckersoni]|uniref:Uncharacterized protein n=1 Tax=Potamilus streckersoni TaxID=2493646 RepID=A0AAE0SDS5_9BIVA|nr:hypothetical protein CHS0354_041206 [Potamilus streckersoni]
MASNSDSTFHELLRLNVNSDLQIRLEKDQCSDFFTITNRSSETEKEIDMVKLNPSDNLYETVIHDNDKAVKIVLRLSQALEETKMDELFRLNVNSDLQIRLEKDQCSDFFTITNRSSETEKEINMVKLNPSDNLYETVIHDNDKAVKIVLRLSQALEETKMDEVTDRFKEHCITEPLHATI